MAYFEAMGPEGVAMLGELLTTIPDEVPVILDAKYDRESLRQTVIEQAASHQIPLQIIHCDAPVEVLKARLNQRQGDIADATADLLAKQLFEPFTATEQPYVTSIDTTQPVEPQLANLNQEAL
jgi:predicted kinase